jgi:hypothetical protein
MLTTLSIISLDQGTIWTDPCPLPREGAATNPDDAPERDGSRWFLSALLGLVARPLGSRSRTSRA